MEKLTTFVVNIILGIIRFMRPVTDKIAVFFASLGKTIDPNRAGMALGFAIVAFSIWLFYVLSKKTIMTAIYVKEKYGLNMMLGAAIMYLPGIMTSYLIGSKANSEILYGRNILIFAIAVYVISRVACLAYTISKAGIKDGLKAFFALVWMGMMVLCFVYTAAILLILKFMGRNRYVLYYRNGA